MDITVNKAKSMNGVIEIPADKSITHRAFMFSALTKGIMKISNYSKGADCMSTLHIIQDLGCEVQFLNDKEVVAEYIDFDTQTNMYSYMVENIHENDQVTIYIKSN